MEILGVIGRAEGLKAEYFDAGAGFLEKEQAGVDHFGVVVDQQAVVLQVLGQVSKYSFADAAMLVQQQFGGVAWLYREFRDPFVGKWVGEVLDADGLDVAEQVGHYVVLKVGAKVRILPLNNKGCPNEKQPLSICEFY